MRLSDELIDSFIDLYKQVYGEVLDRDDAYERAVRLLRLVRVVKSTYYSPEFQADLKKRKSTEADPQP